MASDTEKLLNLSPDDIIIKDNIRFGLKPYRVDRLAEMILEDGGVNTPIEVQKTPDGYVLTAGHYRVAAVSKLNTEQQAGLMVPARVVSIENDAQRVLRQISENNERENLSPMDKAIAMEKLLGAGLSKMDVRKAFAQPGGRKGLKIAPASNSFVNMTLSFLDFPKDIQKKIHDGIIGTGAAYELTKHPKDKWEAILARVEADRIKAIDNEEKDEDKLLKLEKANAEITATQVKAETELAKAREVAETSAKLAVEKAAEVTAAVQVQISAKGDAKKKATEAFKAAQSNLKGAQDAADKAAKELSKLEDKQKAAADKTAAARARLEASRNKGKAQVDVKVGGADIKKAARRESPAAKPTPLNAAEMKEAIKSIVILSGSKKPKTKAAGELILSCFAGEITDGQLQLGLSRLIGEEAPAKVPAAKK